MVKVGRRKTRSQECKPYAKDDAKTNGQALFLDKIQSCWDIRFTKIGRIIRRRNPNATPSAEETMRMIMEKCDENGLVSIKDAVRAVQKVYTPDSQEEMVFPDAFPGQYVGNAMSRCMTPQQADTDAHTIAYLLHNVLKVDTDYIKNHPDLDDVSNYLIDALTTATPEQAMEAVKAAEKRGILNEDLRADLVDQIEFSMASLTPLIDDYSTVLEYLKQ